MYLSNQSPSIVMTCCSVLATQGSVHARALPRADSGVIPRSLQQFQARGTAELERRHSVVTLPKRYTQMSAFNAPENR